MLFIQGGVSGSDASVSTDTSRLSVFFKNLIFISAVCFLTEVMYFLKAKF